MKTKHVSTIKPYLNILLRLPRFLVSKSKVVLCKRHRGNRVLDRCLVWHGMTTDVCQFPGVVATTDVYFNTT